MSEITMNIVNIIERKKKYENEIDRITTMVDSNINFFIDEAGPLEELEMINLYSFYNNIKNVFYYLDENYLTIYLNTIKYIEEYYAEDRVELCFMFITYTNLVLIYPEIFSKSKEDQLLACEIVDAVNDKMSNASKYLDILFDADIRQKLEDIKEKTSFRIPDIYLNIIDDCSIENLELTKDSKEYVLEYLDQFLEEIKFPTFTNVVEAYYFLLNQYDEIREFCLPSQFNYDFLIAKLECWVKSEKYLKYHPEILDIINSDESLVNKLKLLENIIMPNKSKVIQVDFTRR